LLATQFESHHAREVFLCVDEPEAKATFDLTLVTEAGIEVISNTPVKEQHEDNDQLITSFETTPVMSTYLLAWVVGKLDYKEATHQKRRIGSRLRHPRQGRSIGLRSASRR
jgi:aminopeptidase N